MRRINGKILFGLMLATLFLVCFSGAWVLLSEASDGFVEIEISPRGTYLHTEIGYGPATALPVDPPSIVDLQSNGFSQGETILISFEGSINVSAYWNPEEPLIYQTIDKLGGIFSSTNQLLSINDTNRVPGAIDAGDNYDTGVTYFTHESIDIPEDFKIAPPTGFSIEVPQNAKYLFISYADGYYPDNVSPSPIRVTIKTQTSEPTGGFPLEYVLAAIGAVAIIAVLLVFFVLKRRKPRTQSNP